MSSAALEQKNDAVIRGDGAYLFHHKTMLLCQSLRLSFEACSIRVGHSSTSVYLWRRSSTLSFCAYLQSFKISLSFRLKYPVTAEGNSCMSTQPLSRSLSISQMHRSTSYAGTSTPKGGSRVVRPVSRLSPSARYMQIDGFSALMPRASVSLNHACPKRKQAPEGACMV